MSSNEPEKPLKKYEHTTAGLVDALFEEMEDLKNGVCAPHEAVAFSKLATNVIGAMGLQLRRELLERDPRRLLPPPSVENAQE